MIHLRTLMLHLAYWEHGPEMYAKGQCPGGPRCYCCGDDCDCGCRDDCPVWKSLDRLLGGAK